MKLTLKRIAKQTTYTIGKLYIDGVYFCNTVEDKDRGLTNAMTVDEITKKKVYGETAIPSGTYVIDMDTVSEKFQTRAWARPYGGKLPRLQNVKGFNGVLIHPGNTANDSLGCILVGVNKEKGKVLLSQQTFHSLMSKLLSAKDTITLVIE